MIGTGWRRLAAAVVAAAIFVMLALCAPAAFAADVCPNVMAAKPVATGVPYEDQLYAPKSLAPLATGAGVRVAVIDSGLDPDYPQLRGQVAKGRDFLHTNPDGQQDCIGHGTEVASLIAAQPAGDTGFQGLAPGATIVPIRISEETQDFNGDTVGKGGSFEDFADALDWAVGAGHAQVINLSLVTTVNSTPVREAIHRAIAAGVVVVAAAGNHGDADGGNPEPFPASYPGVIGVGAITAGGTKASYSQHGPYVDLVAAGDLVTAAWPAGGHGIESGTSFAAPLVSATVALIIQRYPDATPAEITRRLLATTDPSPSGVRSDDYGAGLLNPYRALTETLGPDVPAAPAPTAMHAEDPAALALAARRDRARHNALVIAGLGAGAVLLIALSAVILRRGRRRGWRSATPSDV